MLRLEIAALYAGVNILILLVLAVLVVAGRRKHKITLGDGGNEAFSDAPFAPMPTPPNTSQRRSSASLCSRFSTRRRRFGFCTPQEFL